MKPLSQLFGSFAILTVLMVGCTPKSSDEAGIRVEIPAVRALDHVKTTSVPASLADFDCLGLNVTGPGIEVTQGLGLVSNLVTSVRGGDLNIAVPVGIERHFKVVGIVSHSGQCPEQISRGALMSSTSYPTLAVVGETKADISVDTTLQISNSYNVATATDLRTGAALGGSPTPAPAPTNCADNAYLFGGGNGSAGSPFQIATVAQWNAIGDEPTRMSCFYIVTAPLNFNSTAPTPIGGPVASKQFTGQIDGGGYTLSQLTLPMLTATERYVGLVSFLKGTVKNLKLENVSVTVPTGSTNLYVGAIAAWAQSPARIEDIEATTMNLVVSATQGSLTNFGGILGVIASGAVTLTEIRVNALTMNAAVVGDIGGVIGKMTPTGCLLSRTRLKNSSLTVAANGGNLGGLVGNHYYGTIQDSLVDGLTITQTVGSFATIGGGIGLTTGAVSRIGVINTTIGAVGAVGGIAGKIAGYMTDSYAQTSITTTGTWAGGAFSQIQNGVGPLFQRVYSASTVANPNTYRRAFSGLNPSGAGTGAESSYFNSTLRADAATYSPYQVTGATTAQMQTQSTYSGWNFSTVWSINSGEYPKLRVLSDLY